MSTEFMDTWLFDSLLVTTLLMGVILLVRRPVAKMFGPGVAYALWLIPAARLLMPSLEGPAEPVGDSALGVSDVVRETILTGVSAPGTVVDTTSKSVVAAIDLTALGITFWLGGAALFFIVQMIRYASMRDDLLSEAEEIANIDGVKVVASDQVAGPLAFGLFKRYIAVPENFTKAYSPAERDLALAHEMAHHKSGDLFANLAAFIILCLQWFNPVAWMSWNAFRFDQEAACDARVLAGKGNEERAIYGQALARTAFDGVPTFATALNSPKTIIERLRRLSMKDASKTRRSIGKLGILTAGAIILPLTATIVPAVVAQEAEKAAEEAAEPAVVKKQVKVIHIKRKDGENVDVISHDGDGKEVTKVQRDGKTYVFHTDKKLSEEEVEKMIAEAEKSRAEAEERWDEAEEARAEAEVARGEADIARKEADKRRAEADIIRGQADIARSHAEVARRQAEVMRVHATAMAGSFPRVNVVRLVPDKVGFPMTEEVYRSITRTAPRPASERDLLEWTLNSLNEARDNYAQQHGKSGKIDRDVLNALDREIGHLKSKIKRM